MEDYFSEFLACFEVRDKGGEVVVKGRDFIRSVAYFNGKR